jgi:hypothetical protein
VSESTDHCKSGNDDADNVVRGACSRIAKDWANRYKLETMTGNFIQANRIPTHRFPSCKEKLQSNGGSRGIVSRGVYGRLSQSGTWAQGIIRYDRPAHGRFYTLQERKRQINAMDKTTIGLRTGRL